MIGVLGPRELVIRIKEKVKTYLRERLKLELSEEKTKITNLGDDRAKFLGTDFHIPSPKHSKVVNRITARGKKKTRINNVRIYLKAPMEKIFSKLRKEGFVKDEIGTPSALTKWIFLDHRGILQRYN